jgi:RHH-type proline utilization regulon transcriptional repressor/proline dehydrogenase/delta 1-pyrroline-5-carboxylate dehydrogenase
MRATDLDEAIDYQNATDYGLTAGIQSLDPQEIRQWSSSVCAGNLYVNRHITGAIVRRQPFGGWKRSVVGPGAKAGGPNYVGSLGNWSSDAALDASDFEHDVKVCMTSELAPVDQSGLVAERNLLRYRPLERVLIRADASVTDEALVMALAAARGVGVATSLSSPIARGLPNSHIIENDEEFAARLSQLGRAVDKPDKVRFLTSPSDRIRLAAFDSGVWVDAAGVVSCARIEAMRWCREQAVSETMHRHGNIRAEVI